MASAWLKALSGTVLTALSMAVSATVITGRLDDPGNPALVGSDLEAPGYADTATMANNVALHAFTLTEAATVMIQSTGFAGGGVDPYFSLFAGAGATATFVDSNYAQAFSTGGDFLWSGLLAGGTYQFALGAFANMSFAENSGSGTLADGFVGLGQAASLGDASYRVVVSTFTVPEPSTLMIVTVGPLALALGLRRRRHHRSPGLAQQPVSIAGAAL